MTRREDRARVERCIRSARQRLDIGENMTKLQHKYPIHLRLSVLSDAFRDLEVASRAIDWLDKTG